MSSIYDGLTIEFDGENVELSEAIKKAQDNCFKRNGELRTRHIGAESNKDFFDKIVKDKKRKDKQEMARLDLLRILIAADKQLRGKMTKKQNKQLQKDIYTVSNHFERRELGLIFETRRKVYRVMDDKKILVCCD